MIAPRPESVDFVQDWLTFHGVDLSDDVEFSRMGDAMSVTVTVGQAESMLNTEFNVFTHSDTGRRVVRTLEYSLPRALANHVDLVHPTTLFHEIAPLHATSFVVEEAPSEAVDLGEFVTGPGGNNISSSCLTTITPSCLQMLYRTECYVPKATKRNAIGINGTH